MFQISAGKSHSAAWTCPPPPRRLPGIPPALQLGRPDNIPLQYSGLSRYSVDDIKGRLRLLHHYSDIIYSTWRLLPLAATKVNLSLSCVVSPMLLTNSMSLFAFENIISRTLNLKMLIC